MEEWKPYILGEIVEKVIDNRGKSAPSSSNERYPLIEINAIGGFHPNYSEIRKYVSDTVFHSWFRAGHPTEGDILIPTVGTIGIVSLMDNCEACIAQNVIALRLKKEFCPEFVYYYLRSKTAINYLLNLNIGGVQPSIKVPHLLKMPIYLPSIETQKAIASMLLSFDNKIELNNRINHNLEEQAQALYKSWFVDFEPFKGGKFVDSELGMIPEGWRVGTLSELLEVRYGKDHKALKDGTIPVFGSGGLMRYVERALFEGESVLIPRKGTLNNVIYVNGAFWTVDTLFYTVERASNAIKYCHLFLLTQDLASMNAGSAVPSMTTDILNNLPLLVPPYQVLNDFNRVLSSIYDVRSQREEESNSLSQSRDTILPQLMTGALTNTQLNC